MLILWKVGLIEGGVVVSGSVTLLELYHLFAWCSQVTWRPTSRGPSSTSSPSPSRLHSSSTSSSPCSPIRSSRSVERRTWWVGSSWVCSENMVWIVQYRTRHLHIQFVFFVVFIYFYMENGRKNGFSILRGEIWFPM